MIPHPRREPAIRDAGVTLAGPCWWTSTPSWENLPAARRAASSTSWTGAELSRMDSGLWPHASTHGPASPPHPYHRTGRVSEEQIRKILLPEGPVQYSWWIPPIVP
jgi:hypothetical protein